MNEIPNRKRILFLIALMAAILCLHACCAEINGTVERMYNATDGLNISESVNETEKQIILTVHNDSAKNDGASQKGRALDEFNGTVYRLGEVASEVTVPVNASRLNLTLPEDVENITLYDEYGRTVTIKSSQRFWQGNYIYGLEFGRHVKGKLVYNLTAQGQQFVISPKEKGPVMVILPEGYTTGERLLGIAWPPPDVTARVEGRKALTWNNTTLVSYIEVSYYRENALAALAIIISILALAAIALLIEYYFSIRKLRALRIREEEEAMKRI